MRKLWTESEVKKLKRLLATEKHTYSEIAPLIGRSRGVCQQKAQALGLKNPAYMKRKTKHKHLRTHVFRYFLNHSFEQTREYFGLSNGELRSIFTVGYRDPKLKKLRKDKRRKDTWTLDETMFLIQNAGIQPRTWIAKKLKRGEAHSVKEALSRLGHGSKHTNGMPITWAEILFGIENVPTGIKTKAGPHGSDMRSDFRFRIIPWVECEQLVEKNKAVVPHEIAGLIRCMAKFQRWIYGTKQTKVIVNKIKMAAKAR